MLECAGCGEAMNKGDPCTGCEQCKICCEC